jgi:hypothetical protein
MAPRGCRTVFSAFLHLYSLISHLTYMHVSMRLGDPLYVARAHRPLIWRCEIRDMSDMTQVDTLHHYCFHQYIFALNFPSPSATSPSLLRLIFFAIDIKASCFMESAWYYGLSLRNFRGVCDYAKLKRNFCDINLMIRLSSHLVKK